MNNNFETHASEDPFSYLRQILGKSAPNLIKFLMAHGVRSVRGELPQYAGQEVISFPSDEIDYSNFIADLSHESSNISLVRSFDVSYDNGIIKIDCTLNFNKLRSANSGSTEKIKSESINAPIQKRPIVDYSELNFQENFRLQEERRVLPLATITCLNEVFNRAHNGEHFIWCALQPGQAVLSYETLAEKMRDDGRDVYIATNSSCNLPELLNENSTIIFIEITPESTGLFYYNFIRACQNIRHTFPGANVIVLTDCSVYEATNEYRPRGNKQWTRSERMPMGVFFTEQEKKKSEDGCSWHGVECGRTAMTEMGNLFQSKDTIHYQAYECYLNNSSYNHTESVALRKFHELVGFSIYNPMFERDYYLRNPGMIDKLVGLIMKSLNSVDDLRHYRESCIEGLEIFIRHLQANNYGYGLDADEFRHKFTEAFDLKTYIGPILK